MTVYIKIVCQNVKFGCQKATFSVYSSIKGSCSNEKTLNFAAMKRIGLISDTHSMLDPKVEKYFEEVDEIWHAGDWGEINVSDGLDEYGKILRGVYGNIDHGVVKAMYPLDLHLNMEGFKIWITHIGGYPGRWGKRGVQYFRTGR